MIQWMLAIWSLSPLPFILMHKREKKGNVGTVIEKTRENWRKEKKDGDGNKLRNEVIIKQPKNHGAPWWNSCSSCLSFPSSSWKQTFHQETSVSLRVSFVVLLNFIFGLILFPSFSLVCSWVWERKQFSNIYAGVGVSFYTSPGRVSLWKHKWEQCKVSVLASHKMMLIITKLCSHTLISAMTLNSMRS